MLKRLTTSKRRTIILYPWLLLFTFLIRNGTFFKRLNPDTNSQVLCFMGYTKLQFPINSHPSNCLHAHSYFTNFNEMTNLTLAPRLSKYLKNFHPGMRILFHSSRFNRQSDFKTQLNSTSNEKLNHLSESKSAKENELKNKIPNLDAFQIIKNNKLGSPSVTDSLKKLFIEPFEVGKFDRFNSYTTICLEQAKLVGHQLDQAIMDKTNDTTINLPLLGLPMAIKDNICTKNLSTTAGSRILENHIPSYDATAVKLLKEAGAIIIGKTNMDEFGMGAGSNFVRKITKNPLNDKLSPGGSSSGSAATVGGGELRASLGSDTGGSIRLPAAWCGCVGLRPSYGRISRYGLIPYASTMDVIGPITQTVEEAGLIFSIIAGPDYRDKTTAPFERINNHFDMSRCKNLPKEAFRSILDNKSLEPLTSEVGTWFDKATQMLQSLGAELISFNLGFSLVQVSHIYYTIALSEALSNLARYDGILYGPPKTHCNPHFKSSTSYNQVLEETRTKLLSNITKLRLLLGGLFLHKPIGPSGSLYSHALILRDQFKKHIYNRFNFIDAIATPTTPSLPKLLNDKESDPWSDDHFLTLASLSGLPAITIPHMNNLTKSPYSLQIVGNYLKEDDLFGVVTF